MSVAGANPSLLSHICRADAENRRMHMFYGQRVVDIPDGLPKWDGLNNESSLIEDSPPEFVKETERKREEERRKRTQEEEKE